MRKAGETLYDAHHCNGDCTCRLSLTPAFKPVGRGKTGTAVLTAYDSDSTRVQRIG